MEVGQAAEACRRLAANLAFGANSISLWEARLSERFAATIGASATQLYITVAEITAAEAATVRAARMDAAHTVKELEMAAEEARVTGEQLQRYGAIIAQQTRLAEEGAEDAGRQWLDILRSLPTPSPEALPGQAAPFAMASHSPDILHPSLYRIRGGVDREACVVSGFGSTAFLADLLPNTLRLRLVDDAGGPLDTAEASDITVVVDSEGGDVEDVLVVEPGVIEVTYAITLPAADVGLSGSGSATSLKLHVEVLECPLPSSPWTAQVRIILV